MGVTVYPEIGFAPGMVMPYAGPTAPDGWLLCDGSLLDRTTYAALYAVVGFSYSPTPGTDPGSNQLYLPDLKGKVIVMRDAAQTEFNVLGKAGGAKTVTLIEVNLPGHTHTLGHTHGMNSVNTRHAHNVYARNQDTGTVSSWHTHNYDHWHTANVGNVGYNYATAHAHHDRGGYVAEAPWEDYRSPGAAIPVNVNGTGSGGTGNPSANHVHSMNHDHPSTNYQDESPWGGGTATNHDHTTNTQSNSTTSTGSGASTAVANLQPYLSLNYLIKI
jgi:microcystin-dependent protein